MSAPSMPVALLRSPGSRLADGIVTHVERRPVDPDLARAQHAAYAEALRRAGFRTVDVEPAEDHPDAVFVEDTVIILPGGDLPGGKGSLAVFARPGAEQRRAEVAGTRRALALLAAEPGRVAPLRTAEIEPPGILDGGDVLRVGDVLYVGRSGRTNDDGIAQLTRLAESRGLRVAPVELRETLHLKSAVTALPDHTLLGLPQHLPRAADLPGLVRPDEPSGAHVVPLGGRAVLMAASAPRTAEQLAGRGWEPVTVDISEFEKLEGCVTCLSVLVP